MEINNSKGWVYRRYENVHMPINVFTDTVKQEFERIYGDRYSIQTCKASRNNGTWSAMAEIHDRCCKEPDGILLDEAYRAYIKGSISMSKICRDLAAIHEEGKASILRNAEIMKDYSKAESRVCCRLINARRNKDILAEVAHVRFLDLAVVFYVIVNDSLEYVPLGTRIFHSWGIDNSTLKERAVINTRERFGSVIQFKDLRQEGSMKKECPEAHKELLEAFRKASCGTADIYFVTNSRQFCGSAAVLYPGFLHRFAERAGSGFFILPLSIHGVVFIPSESMGNSDAWKQLLKYTNEQITGKTHILSDNIYYYDMEERQMQIV